MTTPIVEFISGHKMATNGTSVRQTFGATASNHGIHTQLDFKSNMGGIPPGWISFHWCAKQVPKKKKILNNIKELDPRTHFNKKIWFACMYIYMYVCLCTTDKHLDQKRPNLACALQEPR